MLSLFSEIISLFKEQSKNQKNWSCRMKHDFNGWGVLSREFKSEAHFKVVAAELFGENFESEKVFNGSYLLDGEEIAALFEYLSTPLETKCKVLSEIIAKRTDKGISSGIAKFRQLFCALYSEVSSGIPCIDLRSLSGFDGKTETLSSFIQRNSEKTVELPLPPFAALCPIQDELSARELSLPCGSMIIIDMIHSPVPDEFTLYLKLDNHFGIGTLDPENIDDLLWSAPVLRLHLIPRQ